jgi:hypothetical protein
VRLFEVWEEVDWGIMFGISSHAISVVLKLRGKRFCFTSCQPGPEIRMIAIAALPEAVDNA